MNSLTSSRGRRPLSASCSARAAWTRPWRACRSSNPATGSPIHTPNLIQQVAITGDAAEDSWEGGGRTRAMTWAAMRRTTRSGRRSTSQGRSAGTAVAVASRAMATRRERENAPGWRRKEEEGVGRLVARAHPRGGPEHQLSRDACSLPLCLRLPRGMGWAAGLKPLCRVSAISHSAKGF